MKNFGRYYGYPSESPPMGSVAGGYPGVFQPEFLASPRKIKPYAINSHQRMNRGLEKELFGEKATFVTSIRSPISFFRSAYQYFYERWESENSVKNRKCGFVCWGMPFAKFLEENGSLKFGVSPNEFLDRLPEIFNKDTHWSFRAKNFQAFEFGLDNDRDDAEYLTEQIEILAKLYNFVAISEYYYESLVLLLEVLCLPWHALFAKARMISKDYSKIPFTNRQIENLQKFNAQDIAIYTHFNHSFWDKVNAYGKVRMAHDVKKLKNMYNTCNKQPKRCAYDRPPGVKVKKDDPIDTRAVNMTKLLRYMNDNRGSCEWGAYNRLKHNVETGCAQDKDYFPGF
jgi:galactosylceramide sulfotransferase